MSKQTIADKMAEKTVRGAAFQQSWQAHLRVFGPILAPAFREKYQAQVHLCAALNHISNRKLQEGLDKLKLVEKHIEGEADLAAWLFCHGLAYDIGGDQEKMIQYYLGAARCGHRFYLPYLKVAKAAFADGVLDVAEDQYRAAIGCFDGQDVSGKPQEMAILASAYTNLASVLVNLHRYDEAETALAQSRKVMEIQPGRCATEAMLYAAQGQRERTEAAMEQLKRENRMLWSVTQPVIDQILAGEHPQFPADGGEA